MAFHAYKVQMSYEFTKAIPTNNSKYIEYNNFKNQFGEDGNLLVIGIETDQFFLLKNFSAYQQLANTLKKLDGVTDVISIPTAITLEKDSAQEKLKAQSLFTNKIYTQVELDSLKNKFYTLRFYNGLLYHNHAWLMGLSIQKAVLESKQREWVVAQIEKAVLVYEKETSNHIYLSGLPYIRTKIATQIAKEMNVFIIAFLALSAIILLLFFRSASAMILSLTVVGIGVVFSLGTMHLLHYKITLLTALIPSLMVIIGIPNCIYFLNKYHTAWLQTKNKQEALLLMIEKMGVVTLFCNIAAAIGFAVFSFTKSQILKEFGVVAGINIMALFICSLIIIPVALSYLAPPNASQTKYLQNTFIENIIDRLQAWVMYKRKLIYGVSFVVAIISFIGVLKLKSGAYIVDDLPKQDKIYTDLKFFEKNFKGVMPLEIVIDAKKKYGITRNTQNLLKIDSLANYISTIPQIARPLCLTEGLKFARQAFFDGDSSSYSMPSEFDLPAMFGYLSFKQDSSQNKNSFTKLISSFIDSNGRRARISAAMADVGTEKLPTIIDSINNQAQKIFSKDKYNVQFTGASITFLEGSRYIIKGLKESIFWAFLLIAVCMLYLFKSFKILICSFIPNILPLLVTAGVMGWVGVPLKPSTVLVFSVALGIAIDITIRFLVNYKQETSILSTTEKVILTLRHTGMSILYTALVLMAGFSIFIFSGFGGTQALGWLTTLTLAVATITNLTLLPLLLIWVDKKKAD